MKHLTITVIILLTTAHLFAQTAVIREMTGTVELKTPGSQDWIPARVGDTIESETIISTGFRSSAVLQTGSSTVIVRAITNLSLRSIVENNDETTGVELRSGRIRVEVNPPAGTRANLNVQTPMTVSAVRGTSFELNILNIKVIEGTVRFEANTRQAGFAVQPVLVVAGQKTWMDLDTGKTIKTLDAADINRALPSMPGQGSMPDVQRTQMESYFVAVMELKSE